MKKTVFLLVCVGILLSVSLSGCLHLAAEMGGQRTEYIRDEIYSFVLQNLDEIQIAIEEHLSAYPENTYGIYRADFDGNIYEVMDMGDNRYDYVPVNPELLWLFSDAYDLEILYEQEGVIRFNFRSIGGVKSNGCQGFFYTPDGEPRWVDLKYYRPQYYFDGPFIKVEGSEIGMESDRSYISEEDRHAMRSYYLYVERMTENLYYYKAYN